MMSGNSRHRCVEAGCSGGVAGLSELRLIAWHLLTKTSGTQPNEHAALIFYKVVFFAEEGTYPNRNKCSHDQVHKS
jgi:hypothetical protein